MGKRLVLLFSLFALIISLVSCQSENDTSVQKSAEVEDVPEHSESDSLLAWMTLLKDESQVFRDQGDTQLAVEKLSQAIDQRWREPKTLEEYEKLAWIYTNRAYLYNERQGDFLAAKEDYLSALRQFESCEPSDFLVARYVYQPLGNIYTRLGENEIAISMLEKFKQVCEDNGATEALMNAYNDIGRAHMNASKFEEAIEWFSKGIEIDRTDHFNLGLLYSSKAEAEEKNGESQQAFSSAEKSIQNLNQLIRVTDETDFHHSAAKRYKVGVLGVLAKSIASTKGEQLAHPKYQEALELAKELYPDKHRGLARVYVNLGMSFAMIDNEMEALKCYQSGLNALLDEVDIENFKQRFEKRNLFADVVIGEALFQKAITAHKLYKKEEDLDWLKTSVNTYLTYFDWVEIQRSEQFEFNSKLGTAGEIHQIGESALEAFFDLYEETKDPKWIDTAFILMDQTKAIVLAEERGYKNLAEKNPKLRSKLKKQNALKFQRSRFKADIKNLGEITQENKEESLRLKKRLSEIDEESQLLDQDIRRLLPSYRTQESAKLEGNGFVRLEKKLGKKSASIISYFVGENSVYVISGSPNDFSFNSFPKDTLVQYVTDFNHQLNEPNASVPERYRQAGKFLFDVLVGEEASNLKSNWVVLPDGMLNGLPFEALVSSEKGNSFKQLDYLIREHVIHYAPSAYFFAHESAGKKAERSFLGIAPVFEYSKHYDYLPKSEQELKSGKSLFYGNALIGDTATKSQFFLKAEEYDILHISTHAGKNSGTNNDAWMAFAYDKSTGSKLQAHELLKLDLPSSLVVLNACETGSGTVFKGEGPMSLARGFLNAGSESTVTNLWSVNHESNALIMEYFYAGLSKTKSPSRSLSKAKLAYLKNGNVDGNSAHPYYWSAPILIGSDVSVNEPKLGWEVYIAPIILLLFVSTSVFFFILLRRTYKRGQEMKNKMQN